MMNAYARAARVIFWQIWGGLFSFGGGGLLKSTVQFYPARSCTSTLALLGQVGAAAAPQGAGRPTRKIASSTKTHPTFRKEETSSLLRPSQCEGKFFLWSKSRLCLLETKNGDSSAFPLERFYSNSAVTSLKTCSFCNSLVSQELFHQLIEKSWLICISLFHRPLPLQNINTFLCVCLRGGNNKDKHKDQKTPVCHKQVELFLVS